MVEEQYVTFETAKMAKEKGFNESCKCFYEKVLDKVIKWECNGGIISTLRDEFLCPTQSLLARWLREKYNLYIEIDYIDYIDTCGVKGFAVYLNDIQNNRYLNFDVIPYDTYEEAMEDGLQEALKNI